MIDKELNISLIYDIYSVEVIFDFFCEPKIQSCIKLCKSRIEEHPI